MRKVHIDSDGCSPAECTKLKPLLSSAHYFARLWDREIVFVPNRTRNISETGDVGQRIYIHFFSRPSNHPLADPEQYVNEREAALAHVFYLPVPSDRLFRPRKKSDTAARAEEDVAECLRETSDPVIKDSMNRVVAHAVKNHIYILFHLACRRWDGMQLAFWEICERASVFFKTPRFLAALSSQELMRKNMLKSIETSYERFCALPLSLFRRELSSLRNEMEKKNVIMVETERRLAELSVKIETTQLILDDYTARSTTLDAGISEDFEVIHRFRNVLGVSVEDKGNTLVIITDPITHTDNKGFPRTLSQFKIVFKPAKYEPSEMTSEISGIGIAEWGWRGPFRHNDAKIQQNDATDPKSPCFGGDFARSIRKAILDQDYRVLIHMLMHYLEFDQRGPTARPELTSAPYERRPFYDTEEEREKTRAAYILFVKKHQFRFSKEAMQKELEEFRRQQTQISETWSKQRIELNKLRLRSDFLTDYAHRLPLREQFETLLRIPSIFRCVIGKDFMWLVFGAAQGYGPSSHLWFRGAYRLFVKPLDGKILVWCGHEAGICLTERLRSTEGGRVLNDQDYIFGFFARGCFGDGIAEIEAILRGKSLSSSTRANHAEFTRKEVEKYLSEQAMTEL